MLFLCAFRVLFLVSVFASLCFFLCFLVHARRLLRQKIAPPDRFFRNTWCKFCSSCACVCVCVCVFFSFWCFYVVFLVLFWLFLLLLAVVLIRFSIVVLLGGCFPSALVDPILLFPGAILGPTLFHSGVVGPNARSSSTQAHNSSDSTVGLRLVFNSRSRQQRLQP